MNEFWMLYGEVIKAEGRLLSKFWYVYVVLAIFLAVALILWGRQR